MMKKSSYAITPSYILDDEDLDEGAKVLYSRISMYSDEGRCWASNAHFADKHKVTERTIQNWLKQLSDKEYILIEIDKSGFQTKRDIWITNDFKKFSTKRNTVHVDTKYISPPPEIQFVSSIDINNRDKEQQQQQPVVVVSSDQESLALLKQSGFDDKTAASLAKFSIDRIRRQIENLERQQEIIEIDNPVGWLRSAIENDWKAPEPKVDLEKQEAERKLNEAQERQKVKAECKKLYDEYENRFTPMKYFDIGIDILSMRSGDKHYGLPYDNGTIETLKRFIVIEL